MTYEHTELLNEYDLNSELGKTLVRRSAEQQDEAIKLQEHLNFINAEAKKAVALGDGTLKEANDTYQTLTGKNQTTFQSAFEVECIVMPFGYRLPNSSARIIRKGKIGFGNCVGYRTTDPWR